MEGKCSFCPHPYIIEMKDDKGDPVSYRYCACCWTLHQGQREHEAVIRLEHDIEIRRRTQG